MCELAPLYEACLEFPPDDSVDARLTCPERLPVWLEFEPRDIGFAYACDDAGD